MSRTYRSDVLNNDWYPLRKLKPLIRKYEESNLDQLLEYNIVPKNRLKSYKLHNPSNWEKEICLWKREGKYKTWRKPNIFEHKFEKETTKYFNNLNIFLKILFNNYEEYLQLMVLFYNNKG